MFDFQNVALIFADSGWKQLGRWSDVVGLAGSLFALLAWLYAKRLKRNIERERKRLDRKVTVVLKNTTTCIRLPITLRRGDVTRSEVLGLVGMLPMKKKGDRFSIAYVMDPAFSAELIRVQQSEGETDLEIWCTPDEFQPFDLHTFDVECATTND